jgi:uncharacterized protein
MMNVQRVLERTVFREKRTEILEAASRFGATRIRLFGSIVRGEAHPNSDIDVLVDFEAGRTLIDQAGLLLALQKITGRNVDVATPHTLHPQIKEQVLAEAVEL